ncbi:MAG TPA: SRPBCC family protein [Lysobacter sp.]
MTRLLELLISVAIVAVLFLAVGLALPSSRHLSHSIETNRKPTIVFDTLNSVRRFPQWNPLVLKDPAMQLRMTGPASGKGARIEYSSKEEGLGEGSWEIVESEPNKRVAYRIENIERGDNKRTEFTLRPTGRNNRNVEITQTYDVDYGMNLLGRYAGLYVSSSVGADMKMGLGRLANLLAAVPNIDYSELSKEDPARAPKVVDRPAENLLFVTSAVDRDNAKVQAQMQSNYEWIRKVMAANGLEAAGPVRIITNEFGAETYSFDVAQPVRKAGETGPATQYEGLKMEGPVEAAFNAPTKVATTSYKGHMANLSQVRDALRAWTLTNGYETIERPYETWNGGISAGFTPEGEFNVFWAVK